MKIELGSYLKDYYYAVTGRERPDEKETNRIRKLQVIADGKASIQDVSSYADTNLTVPPLKNSQIRPILADSARKELAILSSR